VTHLAVTALLPPHLRSWSPHGRLQCIFHCSIVASERRRQHKQRAAAALRQHVLPLQLPQFILQLPHMQPQRHAPRSNAAGQPDNRACNTHVSRALVGGVVFKLAFYIHPAHDMLPLLLNLLSSVTRDCCVAVCDIWPLLVCVFDTRHSRLLSPSAGMNATAILECKRTLISIQLQCVTIFAYASFASTKFWLPSLDGFQPTNSPLVHCKFFPVASTPAPAGPPQTLQLVTCSTTSTQLTRGCITCAAQQPRSS